MMFILGIWGYLYYDCEYKMLVCYVMLIYVVFFFRESILKKKCV